MTIQQLGYEGEFGWELQLQSGQDCTGATSYYMIFKAPDGTRTQKTATVDTTLAAGNFDYTVEDGFLTKGVWQVQLNVLDGSTYLYKGPLLRFAIAPAISAS